MTGGGLMQLMAYGPLDRYLMGGDVFDQLDLHKEMIDELNKSENVYIMVRCIRHYDLTIEIDFPNLETSKLDELVRYNKFPKGFIYDNDCTFLTESRKRITNERNQKINLVIQFANISNIISEYDAEFYDVSMRTQLDQV